MYAYDIKQECFLKNVSNNQNYPALHYFAIDNHMYLVKDKKKCKSLTEKAKILAQKIIFYQFIVH